MQRCFGRHKLILCAVYGFAIIGAEANAADDAKKTAAAWLAGLGEKGLVIVENDKENAFAGRMVGSTGTSMHVFQKPGWYINLMFKGKITPDMSLAAVKKNFTRVALDKLPTSGLDIKGWEIKPQTPVSSFSKGVEFLSYKDGILKVRIKTNFFALYGRDPRVLVPADAPTPAHAYFQIRKNFPLDLTIEAPLGMKE